MNTAELLGSTMIWCAVNGPIPKSTKVWSLLRPGPQPPPALNVGVSTSTPGESARTICESLGSERTSEGTPFVGTLSAAGPLPGGGAGMSQLRTALDEEFAFAV